METPVDEQPTFHPNHNDPFDQVVLKANDGMRFRVSEWKLIQNSAHFKSAKDEEPFALSGVIEVDAATEVVGLFLDLINAPRLSIPPTDTATVKDLLSISLQYETSFVSVVRDCLAARIRSAWDLFVIGSDLKDVELARTAINRFSDDKGFCDLATTASLFWMEMRRIRPDWQLSFIYAAFGGDMPRLDSGKGGLRLEPRTDWKATAEDFDPPHLKYTTRPGLLGFGTPTTIKPMFGSLSTQGENQTSFSFRSSNAANPFLFAADSTLCDSPWMRSTKQDSDGSSSLRSPLGHQSQKMISPKPKRRIAPGDTGRGGRRSPLTAGRSHAQIDRPVS